jgi:hypothetical protein
MLFLFWLILAEDVGMGDVAASVGFAGWALAAM